MRYSLSAAALFAATVSADLCALGSLDVAGNYYCQQVEAITYTGVGGAGSYDRVTDMDSGSGSCSSVPNPYSGLLAPLDQEVSFHFRGPLNLKQFAAYAPTSSSTASKKLRRTATERRHAHGHNHAHLHKAREAVPASPVEERQVGAWVTVEMNGQLVSWINEWSGEPTSTPAAPVAAPAVTTPAAAASAASAPSSAGSSSSGSTVGGWAQSAYYNADDAKSNGLVFLNHMGGQGSGVWDGEFGNSLSFASSNGQACAASPQLLDATTLPSSAEVVIMTDSKCEGDACGYYRPGTVAYHGFDGPSKAFLFEFNMPSDGSSAPETNMPAIWMLNALIPRTLQYPSSNSTVSCSCWPTGCGEFDIFEVLAPGDWRAKSTLHGNIAGGDSDFFARPFGATMKLGLVLFDNNIHIKVLPDSTIFDDSLAESFLNEIISSTTTQGTGVSLFSFPQ